MENIVLYRKYRPRTFDEIIGQTHVVKTLQNAIAAGMASHAYLFCGPRGSGKTTIARLLAKSLNCQKPKDGVACQACDSCQEITAAKALDVVEIDAASHTGVDQMRELIEGVRFSPVKSKYKIFIIDECHQLSKAAANALLKTLEEPPAHAVFILATTEAHKMIPTIVSRCQRFDFKRLLTEEIIQKLEFILKKEGMKAEPAALSLIALNARGAMRDAESLLDKCFSFVGDTKTLKAETIKEILGIVDVQAISTLVDFIMPVPRSLGDEGRQQAKEGIEYINQLLQEGTDLQEFTKTLVFYLRQMLLVKIQAGGAFTNSGFSKTEFETLQTQTAKLNEKSIQKILELFMQAEQGIKYATITQLPLELAILDSVAALASPQT